MIDMLKSPFPRWRPLRTHLGLGLIFILNTLQPLFAQDAGDLFRGAWQVESSEEGTLVVILKGEGLASFFWGDNADRTVYPGTWTGDGTKAEITWEDARTLEIERSGSGFSATARSASGAQLFVGRARQLPQEILGQWAKPPTREDEMRSEREQAQGFFGIWRVGDEDPGYVFVEPDRSASSTMGADARGRRGQWAKQGSELHIIWDSGEYSILRQNERGFTYQLIASGSVIEEDESPTRPAIRTIESKVPSDWMADYRAERESSTGGIAFPSRNEARAFYRGDWLIRRRDGRFEKIELARFGGLGTSADRSLSGQWRLSGQDIFMRWDNGIRTILSPVGYGFVFYEYRPGRPLDGVPTRVLAAAPADVGKFEKHLQDRAEVAEQMRELARTAGIDPAQQEATGWGRSFARWVWPFEGDDGSADANEMLIQEFEPEQSRDPWWWPFWSENADAPEAQETEAAESASSPVADDPESGSTASVDNDPSEEGSPSPAPLQDNVEQTDRPAETPPQSGSSGRDWVWPF